MYVKVIDVYENSTGDLYTKYNVEKSSTKQNMHNMLADHHAIET